MRTVTALLIPTSLLFATSRDAVAEEIHETATLDRASGTTGAGADLSFVSDFDDGFVSRLDLHGQWLHQSGFGAYGQLAVSRAFLDSTELGQDIDTIALSNLEIGGQYKRALSSELTIVGHAGLTLPTAQSETGAFFTNLASSQRRFNDLVNAIPDLTAIRLGVSPTWQRGAVFARADLGLDIVVDSSDQMEENPEPIAHANLAVGMRNGKLSGAIELVTMASTGDISEGADRFIHTGALSLRYDAGQFSPTLAIVSPLDDGSRGDSLTLGAGVSAKF
jgi:hypothetical protein